MRKYYVSHVRQARQNGSVKQETVAVFEVLAKNQQVAIDFIRGLGKVHLMGAHEYLSASPIPPRGWESRLEKIGVAA